MKCRECKGDVDILTMKQIADYDNPGRLAVSHPCELCGAFHYPNGQRVYGWNRQRLYLDNKGKIITKIRCLREWRRRK